MKLSVVLAFASAAAILAAGMTAVRAESPLVEAAAAAVQAGNASNAVALANQALQDRSVTPRDRARVLLDRGLAYEILGQHDGALADFTEAINARVLLPVEQARAHYNRGVTLDELGRTEEAIADYTAAIRLNPRFAPALNNRGNAYRRLGRYDAARTDYLASLAANNPRPEYPNFGLGQIAEIQRQRDEARRYYQAALAANPQFSLASERLSVLQMADATTPVVLRPPGGVSPSAPVTLKPPGQSPIQLRPPGEAPVQLRPPAPRTPPVARREPPAPIAPATAPPLKPALSEGSPIANQIQLGAWRNEAEAADAWNRATSSGGNLLAGLSPRITAVDLPGKGRYYRLRAGPVTAGNAPGLCAALKAKGLECAIARD